MEEGTVDRETSQQHSGSILWYHCARSPEAVLEKIEEMRDCQTADIKVFCRKVKYI